MAQNKGLDIGTNPPEVAAIIDLIKVIHCYKLPGAGVVGYTWLLKILAALRIRRC